MSTWYRHQQGLIKTHEDEMTILISIIAIALILIAIVTIIIMEF